MALRDLRQAFSFWLRVDPALAARLVAAIDARADWIGENASLGSPFRRRQRKSRVPDAPYLLFYRYDDGMVEILRVRHTSENWLPR